jgi:hypothetical protein
MAHPYHHALSSARQWGGKPGDYQAVHDWFDESKAHLADFRHRALRHHAEGIFWAEQVFGATLTNSDGRAVPVRWLGEQHVREDLGWIPTLQDWFRNLRARPWMARRGDRVVGGGRPGESPGPALTPEEAPVSAPGGS